MKKIAMALMVFMMMGALTACDSFSKGVQDGMNGKETQEETAEPVKETTNAPEETTKELESEPKETEPATDQETDAAEPENDNPLMKAELQVLDVSSGTGEKIGEWAEITVQKEIIKGVTQEQYAEFCESVVKDSGYNWVTISCGDGTGIQFAGSISYAATYGNLDNEGCITETIGTIMIQEDGTYSYTPAE